MPISQRPSLIPHEVVAMEGIRTVGQDFHLAERKDAQLRIRLAAGSPLARGSCIRMSVVIESCAERVSSQVAIRRTGKLEADRPLKRHHHSGALQEYLLLADEEIAELLFGPHRLPGPFWMRSLTFHHWSEAAARGAMTMDLARRWRDPVCVISKQVARCQTAQQRPGPLEMVHQEYWNDAEEVLTNPYSRWAHYTEAAQIQQQQYAASQEERILFSLVVPIFNTKPEHLRACLDSVRSQTYTNWELCLVDDGSTDPSTRQELETIKTLDPRIRLKRRKRNAHICVATNEAIDMAEGKFIGFLDHDDTLAQHALARVAKLLREQPQARLVYSDEDNLDEQGNRINPHFKSDWNHHLLCSHNYITHFLCIESSLVREVGGLREGLEGAQDYDLILRASERLTADQIQHIPEILYHWRRSPQSTARSASAKPYTVESGLRALRDHFRSRGDAGTVVEPLPVANYFQTAWPVGSGPVASVCLIIPTRDNHALLRACIESILKRTKYQDYTILIIDNGSQQEDTLAYLNTIQAWRNPKINVQTVDCPFNFSRLINAGYQQAKAELICLLNDDIEVAAEDWLSRMAGHARRPEVGCVGAKLLYPDGTLQHAGLVLRAKDLAFHAHKHQPNSDAGYFNRPHLLQEVSAVTGACLLVRSKVYAEAGGLDETLFGTAYNDVDLCLKVRSLGYVNLYVPEAVLIHHESRSRGYEDSQEKRSRLDREKLNLWRTWGPHLIHDPYYNPNLSSSREDFSLRLP